MHNAFKKCIGALEGGHALEQLNDLHNWFKDKLCKIDNFKNLRKCVIMSDESLFL